MDKNILEMTKKAALKEKQNINEYVEQTAKKNQQSKNSKNTNKTNDEYNMFNVQQNNKKDFVITELNDLFDVQKLIEKEQADIDAERARQKNKQRGVYESKDKKLHKNDDELKFDNNSYDYDINQESIYAEGSKKSEKAKKKHNNIIKGNSTITRELRQKATDIVMSRIDYSMEFGGLSSLRNFDSIKKISEAILMRDVLNNNVELAEQRFALYNKESLYSFESDLKKAGILDKDATLDLSTITGKENVKQNTIHYLRARGIIHAAKEENMTLSERIVRRTIIEKNYKNDKYKTAYQKRREEYGIADYEAEHSQSKTDITADNIIKEVINPTPDDILTDTFYERDKVENGFAEINIHNISHTKRINKADTIDDFDIIGEKYQYGKNVSSGTFKQKINKGQADEVQQICNLSDKMLAKIVENKEKINGIKLTNADIVAIKLLRDTDNAIRANKRLNANEKMIKSKKVDLVFRNSPFKDTYLSYRRFTYKRRLYTNICKNVFKITIFLQKNMIVAGVKVTSGTYSRIKNMVIRGNKTSSSKAFKGNNVIEQRNISKYRKSSSPLLETDVPFAHKSNLLLEYANLAGDTFIGNSVRRYARKRADLRNVNNKRKIKSEQKKNRKNNLRKQRRKNRFRKKEVKRKNFARKHPFRAKIRAKIRNVLKKPLKIYFKIIDFTDKIKQAILKKFIVPAVVAFIKIMAIIIISIIVLASGIIAAASVISWFAGFFDFSMDDAYSYVIEQENQIINEKILYAQNENMANSFSITYYTMDNKGNWVSAKSQNNAKEIVSMISTALDDQVKDNGALTKTGKKNFKNYASDLINESIDVKVTKNGDNAKIGVYLYSFKTGDDIYKLNKDGTLFALDNKSGGFIKYLSEDKKKNLEKKGKVTKKNVKSETKKKETSWLDLFSTTAQAKKISNPEYAFNFFVSKGCNKNTAAAIVGNLIAESGVNPGMSGGIAQWQGGRLSNLQNYCKNHGYSWQSLDGQLNYMWFELKTGYIKALSDAQKSVGLQYFNDSDKGAVYYIARYYEGCIITDSWHRQFGCKREGPTQIKNHKERTQDYYKRLDAAKNIYNGGSLTGNITDGTQQVSTYDGPPYWDEQTMGLAIAKYSVDWKEVYDIDTTQYNIDTSKNTLSGNMPEENISHNTSEELKNTQKKEEYFPKGFSLPVKKVSISQKTSGKVKVLNTQQKEKVKCGADGNVVKIDKSNKYGGNYIVIKTSKCYLIYGNIKYSVKNNQSVKKGQVIGSVNGDKLYFVILNKDKKEIDADFALQEDSIRTLAASYGLKFVGGTYVWGGTDLEHCLSKNQNQGVDCSGFVMKCYQHYNVYTLPHQSISQYNSTSRIKEKDLIPGDLIFYSKSGKSSEIHHVAMYIGNGQIVHAKSRNTGIVVDKYTYSSGIRLYGRVKLK